MKVIPIRCCAALLALMLGAWTPGQTEANPEKLVEALSSRDWRERNQAAVALCARANDLSAAIQGSLWHVAGEDVGAFERREFAAFDHLITPSKRGAGFRAVGYFALPEVYVPATANDLTVPFGRQVLALLVLQQVKVLAPQHLGACLKSAEKENDRAANQMLYALAGRFGEAAAEQYSRRFAPAVARFAGGKELVGMMRLLPHLGEPGWSVLHDLATDEERPMIRRAALRVMGMTKHDVEVDLFVAQRLLIDSEAQAEACGVLTQSKASREDPALVDYLIKTFDRAERRQRLLLLAVLAHSDYRGRAAKVADAFLVRALGSEERSVVSASLEGLRLRLRSRSRMFSAPDAEAKLIGLARGGDRIASEATSLLRKLAERDDAMMARLLDQEVLAVAELRKLYGRDPRLHADVDKAVDEAFGKATYVGDGANQVRLARALASKPWPQLLPDAMAQLRAELQSGDVDRIRAVSAVVEADPMPYVELAPLFRELTKSDEKAVSLAAWYGLVRLLPDELPAAIKAKHVGRWDAGQGALLGHAPRKKLIALFDDWDKSMHAAAVRFLARNPDAIPDLFAGLMHSSDVVRKECLITLPRWIPAEHTALLHSATKRLGAKLADAEAPWPERMEAARMLIDLVAVGPSDVEVLCGLSGKLKMGKVPQQWNSSIGLGREPLFKPPTRWEVFTEVERKPATPTTIAWLQRGADISNSAVFRDRCRDLLQRFQRREQLVAKAGDWFAADASERAQMLLSTHHYSDREARSLIAPMYAALRAVKSKQGRDTLPPLHLDDAKQALKPSTLLVGNYEFPYVLLAKGDKPAAGWPLYICMHGGGGNGKAKGPHSWNVNTSEWQAQKFLFQKVYEPAGIYFIPRMADDRRGRWWHDHNQIAFEQVIEQCLLFRDVDPNRVYLMGISEGGYGAIRFAGNHPDRYAATGGMAAAEPMSSSPPENMRNVAMRIDIGEKDTMYDRVGLARRMGERLAELQQLDPDGYDYSVNIQAGRGHGIDYSHTPKWLAGKVRNPRPKRVVWTIQKFDSRVASQHYWLALDAVPDDLPWFVDARISGNEIVVTVEKNGPEKGQRQPVDAGRLLLRLDDRLVDLDYDVHVVLNGRSLPAKRVARSFDVMLRTMAERSDPESCYCAELSLDLAPATGR